MKEGIHPNYVEATVSCACGNNFKTSSTKALIKLDICAKCHPFFTGQQKLIDSAGRVERFEKRFAKTAGETLKKTAAAAASKAAKGQKIESAALKSKRIKILSSAPIKIPVKPGRGPGGPGGKSGDKPAAKAADKPAAKAH